MKVLLALLFTVNMFGNVSPDYITTNYYDPSVVISFDTWKTETLSIKIISQSSDVIFSDKLNTLNSEGIKYNLRNLGSGKYTIKLENEVKLVEETVILFDGKIVEKEAKVYYKPSVNIEKGFVNVNFLSFDGNINIEISKNGTLYFEDSATNVKPFSKVYNANGLDRGLYTVTVSNSKVSTSTTLKL